MERKCDTDPYVVSDERVVDPIPDQYQEWLTGEEQHFTYFIAKQHYPSLHTYTIFTKYIHSQIRRN